MLIHMPRLEDEILALEQALARNPRDAAALRRLSGLLQKKGERGAAAGCLQRLAHLYDEGGVRQEAVAVLRQAVRLEPRRLDLLDDLARHCVSLGERDQALAALERLAEGHARCEDPASLVEVLQRIRALDLGWRPPRAV